MDGRDRKTHDRSVIIHVILGLPAPTAKKNFVGGNFTANMPSLIAKMVHGKFRCYYSQCDQHCLHNHATAMCTNIIAHSHGIVILLQVKNTHRDTHTHNHLTAFSPGLSLSTAVQPCDSSSRSSYVVDPGLYNGGNWFFVRCPNSISHSGRGASHQGGYTGFVECFWPHNSSLDDTISREVQKET